jgi:hypothetical protein
MTSMDEVETTVGKDNLLTSSITSPPTPFKILTISDNFQAKIRQLTTWTHKLGMLSVTHSTGKTEKRKGMFRLDVPPSITGHGRDGR